MMTKTNNSRVQRTIALLAIVMAALMLMLSALYAPDAEAKKKHKKHHKRPPAINVVLCPTEDDKCLGTGSADYLLGRVDRFDEVGGGEGDDVYDGKGGSDFLEDFSATSNDLYLVPAPEFSAGGSGTLGIQDRGGNSDVLDLSAYKSTDFTLSRAATPVDLLKLDGPGKRDIILPFFFTTNSIDLFKFSDGTLTAEQIKSKV